MLLILQLLIECIDQLSKMFQLQRSLKFQFIKLYWKQGDMASPVKPYNFRVGENTILLWELEELVEQVWQQIYPWRGYCKMAKEFHWKGKSEEEIKRLSLKEFTALVPARSRRSLERGFTDAQKILLKEIDMNAANIKTHCRDMIIIPKMIGKILRVYNGKEYTPVPIAVDMVGHYLGEFVMTRKGVTHSAAGIGATRSSKAVSAR